MVASPGAAVATRLFQSGPVRVVFSFTRSEFRSRAEAGALCGGFRSMCVSSDALALLLLPPRMRCGNGSVERGR